MTPLSKGSGAGLLERVRPELTILSRRSTLIERAIVLTTAAGFNAARWQVNVTVISNNRECWIEAFRDAIAETCGATPPAGSWLALNRAPSLALTGRPVGKITSDQRDASLRNKPSPREAV
jgi:hypothetical protein